MDKEKIISFIKQNRGAEIAELQKKFDITYKEAKEVIDELVSGGDLVYAEGVKYNYIGEVETSQEERRTALERRRAEAIKKIRNSGWEDVNELPEYGNFHNYLATRSRMFEDADDDDDDDEYSDEDLNKVGMDDDELRQKALKLCIETGTASASLFQRTFPIGYIRACELVDWMEEQGYISKQNGQGSRKVLITEEDYDILYPFGLPDDSKDDTEDEKFSAFNDLFLSINDSFKNDSAATDAVERKPAIQNLVNVLSRITERKKEPVRADAVPVHNLWVNDDEFAKAVMERMKVLIISDKKMGKQGAVKKAESYLEAVRDTHDGKMVQVYERLVYEIKNTSDYMYGQLKKQLCGD